ncbi:MAG: hypothetical protein ACLSUW_09130 [Akkermansia sp.]
MLVERQVLCICADVEGLCSNRPGIGGIARAWRRIPMTYAGGISRIQDFEEIDALSGGALDATVGSALDLFGGRLIRYADLVERQRGETEAEKA